MKTVSEIHEPYLKKILRYFNYWVNDINKAEELTLRTLRNLSDGMGQAGDEEKTHIRIFRHARKELQAHLKSGSLRTIFPGLSTLEHEVLSLRLGALLPTSSIARILGRSRSGVIAIVYRSLYKLKVNKENS